MEANRKYGHRRDVEVDKRMTGWWWHGVGSAWAGHTDSGLASRGDFGDWFLHTVLLSLCSWEVLATTKRHQWLQIILFLAT